MINHTVGKIVLVTGGATGIGALIIRNFLAGDAKHVAILDISVENGKALEQELNQKHGAGKAKFYKCDVTNEIEFKQIFDDVAKEQGYIDVVVNNAGIMNDHPNVYRKEVAINVTGLMQGSLMAYELMRKDKEGKGGAIINISSIAALSMIPSLPVYFATKAAVIQFSRCAGMDINYSRTGVKFIVLCFGATETPLLVNSDPFDAELKDIDSKIFAAVYRQKPESAANGAVEAYKQSEKGCTVWLIHRDEPAVDITDNIDEGYKTMASKMYIDQKLASLKND